MFLKAKEKAGYKTKTHDSFFALSMIKFECNIQCIY